MSIQFISACLVGLRVALTQFLDYSKHEKYKAKTSRMKSYREMISEFKDATGIQLNVVELKIKIKNLRSTYKQELTKIKRRSSPDSTFKSSLKWFALWHKHFASTAKDEADGSYDDVSCTHI